MTARDLIIMPDGTMYEKHGSNRLNAVGAETYSQLRSQLACDSQEQIQALFYEKGQDYLAKIGLSRYRISILETVEGYSVAIRRVLESPQSLDDLKFPVQLVHELQSLKEGFVLFSGPMGSGKTTSASGFIKDYLSVRGGSCVTMEDPPELALHGPHGNKGLCEQCEVPFDQFASTMVRILRHAAPEVIFLGELREAKGTREAIRAANNGTLVVATVHAGNVSETIRRIINLADSNSAHIHLADCLTAIISQKLTPSSDGLFLQLESLFVKGTEEGPAISECIRNGKNQLINEQLERQKRRRGW